jgi:nucleoid-associated protein YgaU
VDDGRTEPFEPYQPETSYEWDYEEQPPKSGAPKILWGRVIAIFVVLLAAFFIGRATGGSDGVPQSQVDQLEEDNDRLRQELQAALAQQDDQNDTTPAPEDATESPPPDPSESEIYVVKPGDTLRGIAEDKYGDAGLADLIAEQNGIDDPTSISVGQELIIPPKPEE